MHLEVSSNPQSAIRNPQLIAALKYLSIRNPQSEIRN